MPGTAERQLRKTTRRHLFCEPKEATHPRAASRGYGNGSATSHGNQSFFDRQVTPKKKRPKEVAKGRNNFFFEQKEAKKLLIFASGVFNTARSGPKVFWFFFSKKNFLFSFTFLVLQMRRELPFLCKKEDSFCPPYFTKL
jgi:hypothetical protein